MSAEEYFIIIGSCNYRDEILNQIRTKYGKKFPVCYNAQSDFLDRVYDNILDMLHQEPSVIYKIDRFKIEQEQLNQLIVKTQEVLNLTEIDSHMYRLNPIGNWSISFFVDEKYFVRLAAYASIIQFKIKQLVKDEVGFNKELIIYEDESGISIEHVANSMIDWNNEENIKSALIKIRMLHNSNLKFDFIPKFNLIEKINRYQKWCDNRNLPYIKDLPKNIINILNNNELIKEVNSYRESLCHGDFTAGNVVLFNDDMEIIDLGSIQMGDPIVDICSFLMRYDYKEKNFFDIWKHFFNIYYGREITKHEFYHAKIVEIFSLYYRYLGSIVTYLYIDEKYKQWTIERMTFFDKLKIN